ncbi:MAG: flavodoxin family protein [Proteobacteria bacterium]|nr:flavodoxin family protein [Pseudomonadota bacterium]
MKTLVVYSSQTNNTKRLAEAAATALNAEMVSVGAAGDISNYDHIAVGFWFKGGGPDPATQDFLPKLSGKKAFLFATHGGAANSTHVKNGMNKARDLAAGATVAGSFSCPGEVPVKVQAAIAEKNPNAPWLPDAPAATGHPDEKDLSDLRKALRDSFS